MTVSENLKKSIEEKNIKAVRDCLLACIVIDPSMSKSFNTSFQYCLDNGITEAELYEVHDNGNLDIEATKENFSLLCGQLRTNFSKERLEKIKEIASVIYPAVEDNKSKNSEKKSVLAWFDRHPEVRLIIASSVGALVLGIAGGCLFKKDISNIDKEIKMIQKGVAFGIGFGSVVGAALGTTAGIVINKFLKKKQE